MREARRLILNRLHRKKEIGDDTRTHRQQYDNTSLLTKVRGHTQKTNDFMNLKRIKHCGGYTNRWADTNGYTDRHSQTHTQTESKAIS
jgi:hypothetical protein